MQQDRCEDRYMLENCRAVRRFGKGEQTLRLRLRVTKVNGSG